MKSRERILMALAHKETDRVPRDLGSSNVTSIAARAYARLRQHLNLPDRPVRLLDLAQVIATVDEDMLDALGGDAVALPLPRLAYGLRDERGWGRWTLPDGTICQVPKTFRPTREDDGSVAVVRSGQVVARMSAHGHSFSPESPPLAEAHTVKDLKRAMARPFFSPRDLPSLAMRGAALRASTDRAIVAGFGLGILEEAMLLRGMERFLEELATPGSLADTILDLVTEHSLDALDQGLAAVGEVVDVVRFGDDLAEQSRPLMSLTMFREKILPRLRLLFERVHSFSGESRPAVMLHSCGAVEPLVADLIEAGMEILNPVQINSQGMDPAKLKARYGKDITFWGGGCDPALLAEGSADEVAAQTAQMIKTLGKGGGFVLAPIHNILAEVPPENVVALYR